MDVDLPSSQGHPVPIDQAGNHIVALDQLQFQASKIHRLVDAAVFFRSQLEKAQADGIVEFADSAYQTLISTRAELEQAVRGLRPTLLELEHPLANVCDVLARQIGAFELMTQEYQKFSHVINQFVNSLPRHETVDAAIIGRLMNNVRLGHYPTDLEHVGHRARGIVFPEKNQVNLLDPCCGTGDALLRLALGNNCRCYGIELDTSRAELAQEKLFRVGFGSYFSSQVGTASFHAIFLNPPYLSVTTGCGLRTRDEKRFLIDCVHPLMMGGLIIYIIPYYRMTEDICQIFTDNFDDISVYRFMDREFKNFKQIAVLGVRKHRASDAAASEALFESALHPETLPVLNQLPDNRYTLPDVPAGVKLFRGSVFNEAELSLQLMASTSVEKMLQERKQDREAKRPPLPLSIGQVGLIGGSGLMNGLVKCECPHIVKGRIIKERHERKEENRSPNGTLISTDITETITNRMVFNILTPKGFRSLT